MLLLFLGFVCDFLVAGCRFRSGFGHFTFFAFAVGGNASPFLDADDSTGQLDEALLPLVSGVGALLAGQYGVQPECQRSPSGYPVCGSGVQTEQPEES